MRQEITRVPCVARYQRLAFTLESKESPVKGISYTHLVSSPSTASCSLHHSPLAESFCETRQIARSPEHKAKE